jgi:hypothetical protein
MILGIILVIGMLVASSLVAVLWLVGKSAVTQEASNVLPDATRTLIDRAKNRLPEEARQRYEEEWPAGFEEAIEKRPIWAFREAVSLYRGAGRIARALEPSPEFVGRGRFRIGFAADSAAARASDLAARIKRPILGFPRRIELIMWNIAKSLYDLYDARIAGSVLTELSLFRRIFTYLVLLVSLYSLLHDVFGWP